MCVLPLIIENSIFGICRCVQTCRESNAGTSPLHLLHPHLSIYIILSCGEASAHYNCSKNVVRMYAAATNVNQQIPLNV